MQKFTESCLDAFSANRQRTPNSHMERKVTFSYFLNWEPRSIWERMSEFNEVIFMAFEMRKNSRLIRQRPSHPQVASYKRFKRCFGRFSNAFAGLQLRHFSIAENCFWIEKASLVRDQARTKTVRQSEKTHALTIRTAETSAVVTEFFG